MKHQVKKAFIDKESGVYYALGSSYISENIERVMSLEKMGFVKASQGISSLKIEKKVTPRKKASE